MTSEDLLGLAILKDQPPPVLQSMVENGLRREIVRGETIIRCPEPPSAVYFLLSGQVRVQLLGHGQRKITYQILRPGEMFGELACIDGGPRTADVTAETKASIAQIPLATFRRLTQQHAAFAEVVMRRVVALSRWLSERVFEYHAYNLMGRICAELLRLSQVANGMQFTVTDEDMASRVGTTRETVNKLVWQIIEREPEALRRREKSSNFQVLDPARLRTLLNSCELS